MSYSDVGPKNGIFLCFIQNSSLNGLTPKPVSAVSYCYIAIARMCVCTSRRPKHVGGHLNGDRTAPLHFAADSSGPYVQGSPSEWMGLA